VLSESICKFIVETYSALVTFHFVSFVDGLGLHAAEWFCFPTGLGTDVAQFDVAGNF
jgi:hypothetical protein